MRYLVILLITVCAHCFAQEATAPCASTILNYVENNLPHCGVLKSTGRFVYVDVDDAYIHQLIAFIQEEGFEEPPYFDRPDAAGAHITVIYPDEVEKYGVKNIEECGEIISFVPLACQVVEPPKWPEIDAVYFIVMDAPELDRIREKYCLPKREYAFHITIGVKPKLAQAA